MKNAFVFLADGFEEIEAFTAIDVLRRSEVMVQMVSVTEDEIVRGAHDISVLCDKIIDNCDFSQADLLLLPGGMPGATNLAACEYLGKQLKDFAHRGKLLAAICAAPMVLGKLGLLKGLRATCYPGFESFLQGAEYTGALVECDGNVITGKGPAAAMAFGLKVAEYLVGKEKADDVATGMLVK